MKTSNKQQSTTTDLPSRASGVGLEDVVSSNVGLNLLSRPLQSGADLLSSRLQSGAHPKDLERLEEVISSNVGLDQLSFRLQHSGAQPGSQGELDPLSQRFHVIDFVDVTRLGSRVGKMIGSINWAEVPAWFLPICRDGHSAHWEAEVQREWREKAPFFSKKRKVRSSNSPTILKDKMEGAVDILAVMLQTSREDIVVVQTTATVSREFTPPPVPDLWGRPGGNIKKCYEALRQHLGIPDLPTFEGLLTYVRCLRRCCWIASCLGYLSPTVQAYLERLNSCTQADAWFKTWSQNIINKGPLDRKGWEGSISVHPAQVVLERQTVSLVKSVVLKLLPSPLHSLKMALVVSRQVGNLHASHALCGKESIRRRYELINVLGGEDTESADRLVMVKQWSEFVSLMEPAIFFWGLSKADNQHKELDKKSEYGTMEAKTTRMVENPLANNWTLERTAVELVSFEVGQDPLRDLSQQELERVSEYLSNDNTEEIVANWPFIYNKSIMKLRPKKWLNDQVIDNYNVLLSRRDAILCSHSPGRLRNHFFPTNFYPKLVDDTYDYNRVKRYSKYAPGRDLFALDKLFFPICAGGNHWILVVVYLKKKEIRVYNSLGPCFMHKLQKEILYYLQLEHLHKMGINMQTMDWTLTLAEGAPQQGNGNDCGVFVCYYTNYLSKDAALDFDQKDITRVGRQRLVLALVEKRL